MQNLKQLCETEAAWHVDDKSSDWQSDFDLLLTLPMCHFLPCGIRPMTAPSEQEWTLGYFAKFRYPFKLARMHAWNFGLNLSVEGTDHGGKRLQSNRTRGHKHGNHGKKRRKRQSKKPAKLSETSGSPKLANRIWFSKTGKLRPLGRRSKFPSNLKAINQGFITGTQVCPTV